MNEFCHAWLRFLNCSLFLFFSYLVYFKLVLVVTVTFIYNSILHLKYLLKRSKVSLIKFINNSICVTVPTTSTVQ